MLSRATVSVLEVKCWPQAWQAFPGIKAHICILYSRKFQSGPWPGDLFIMSKIKAPAMFGTRPPPPFSCNHLVNQAGITVNRAFQTKVWWSFINITRQWPEMSPLHGKRRRYRKGQVISRRAGWKSWVKPETYTAVHTQYTPASKEYSPNLLDHEDLSGGPGLWAMSNLSSAPNSTGIGNVWTLMSDKDPIKFWVSKWHFGCMYTRGPNPHFSYLLPQGMLWCQLQRIYKIIRS